MSKTHESTQAHDGSAQYEICLKGHLDKRWANWFEGLTIALEESGATLLTGTCGRSGRISMAC